MSARDDLLRQLSLAVGVYDRERDEDLVVAVVREALVDAANDLRNFIGPEVFSRLGDTEPVRRYVLGWHHAARRIDPGENL